MRQDSALSQAFAGCGIFHPGNTISAATLDRLGEALIDATWKCLPIEDQESALLWPHLTIDDRLKALSDLQYRLLSRLIPEDEPTIESADAALLPLEMGEWDNHRPSKCLPMALRLAAYAQCTVGPGNFYVASVQRMASEPVNNGLEDIFGQARGLIENLLPEACTDAPHPSEARGDDEPSLHRLLGDLKEAAGNSANVIANRKEFHNLVIFPIRNGWCVDPYQGNLSALSSERSIARIGAELGRDPAAAVTMNGNPAWLDLPRFKQELEVIKQAASRGTLLDELRAWATRVWESGVKVATSSPHFALSVSLPARSLAVRVLINLRLRDPRTRVIAADLLPFSQIDTVLYHAMRERSRMTPYQKKLLDNLIGNYRRAPKNLLHPLLVEQLHGNAAA